MPYRSGRNFERVVFGESSDLDVLNSLPHEPPDFNKDLRELIRQSSLKFPQTILGESLYNLVARELDRLGVSSEGLIFVSAVNTKVDLRHYLDGFFYLPSALLYPVTIDLFNLIGEGKVFDFWVESFDGEQYSWCDYQNDLFQYKTGLSCWAREHKAGMEEPDAFGSIDFRLFSNKGRPENHFILTPDQMESPRRRKHFAKMVARHIASKVPSHETAQKKPK